jgi:hypothetical protein
VAFLRFVLSRLDSDSGVEAGLFGLAIRLREDPDISAEDRQALRDELAWFNERLATPERFNRSTSKGYYRRNTRGIAWFRDNAHECISRMHKLKRVLEANGHVVDVIRENKIGYVYEDELQVIAEPFSNTRTGN